MRNIPIKPGSLPQRVYWVQSYTSFGLGGFGIKSVNEHTGEQKYTPIRFSSSWLNVVYGQKWKPGIFVGYAKNLGTSDALYAPDGTDAQVYGTEQTSIS